MNYDIERKLNSKVDEWRFNGLEQEVSGLKSKVSHLEGEITDLKNKISNQYYAYNRLLEFLIESNRFNDEKVNELYNIKNSF